MSIDATRWAWMQQELRYTQKMVLLALVWQAGDDNTGYAEIEKTAKMTEMDVRTVSNCIHDLNTRGLVLIEFLRPGGCGYRLNTAHIVHVRFPKLTKKEEYGRLEGVKWAKIREFIFERDSHTCTYCGAKDVELVCDHIYPLSKGGSNYPHNLTTSCVKCNCRKGSKLPVEWNK